MRWRARRVHHPAPPSPEATCASPWTSAARPVHTRAMPSGPSSASTAPKVGRRGTHRCFRATKKPPAAVEVLVNMLSEGENKLRSLRVANANFLPPNPSGAGCFFYFDRAEFSSVFHYRFNANSTESTTKCRGEKQPAS